MYGQFNYAGYPANRYEYQQPRQNQVQAMPLNGRLVTGIEEARASQIALDGTPSYFPSPAENKIYVKSLDMNGLPIFLVYKLDTPINCEQISETKQNVSISQFISRIEALERKVKELEHNEPNGNTANG